MSKIKGVVKVYNGDIGKLGGYQQITGHFILDIKVGKGFRYNAYCVGDCHKTRTPTFVTYSSVVSRDSLGIILIPIALNDLYIEGKDIWKAQYLNAYCQDVDFDVSMRSAYKTNGEQ